MRIPVVVALAVVVAIAVLVFVGSKRGAGSWLLVAGVVLAVAGGVLWSHEPSHRRTVVVGAGSGITKTGEAYMSLGRIVTTGRGPNHVPAVLLFVVGGAAGLFGLLLNRRTAPPATDQLESN